MGVAPGLAVGCTATATSAVSTVTRASSRTVTSIRMASPTSATVLVASAVIERKLTPGGNTVTTTEVSRESPNTPPGSLAETLMKTFCFVVTVGAM